MDRKLAFGTTAFAVFTLVFGLAIQVLIDASGIEMGMLGSFVGYVVVPPLALLAAMRVGRLNHLSVLLGSAVVEVFTLWMIVVLLASVAGPAGVHVGWATLFDAMNWRHTVQSIVGGLLAPQVWLWLLTRRAIDDSSRPTPLRDAA